MMLLIAFVLGMIEGLTEFLPVSSTGHLILFGDLLGFKGPEGKTFEIIIQLGAILAICWHYREKLFRTTLGVLKRRKQETLFAEGIMLAFLPAMLLGALFHDVITKHLFNPVSVSVALIVGGIVILVVEKMMKPVPCYTDIETIPLVTYFKIGVCQCFALIPGTSRSGATIIGALLLGVERKVATECSFFLAIPTMLAATAYSIYKNWRSMNFDDVQLIAVGFCAAFLSALLVVKIAINYISRHGFAPFAYYRIVLGVVMLGLLQI